MLMNYGHNNNLQIMENEAYDLLKNTLIKKIYLTRLSPQIFISEMPLKYPSKLSKTILLLVSAQLPKNGTAYFHI